MEKPKSHLKNVIATALIVGQTASVMCALLPEAFSPLLNADPAAVRMLGLATLGLLTYFDYRLSRKKPTAEISQDGIPVKEKTYNRSVPHESEEEAQGVADLFTQMTGEYHVVTKSPLDGKYHVSLATPSQLNK